MQDPEDIARRMADIRWFHQIELAPGVVTPGLDRSQDKLARLALPARMDGKSVLDIGAWDGFFSFEAERRGAAQVLATDHFCWSGPGWGTKAGFDFAHEALHSKVEDREIDVEALSVETVGAFDIVFFLGVFYHLKDPIAILDRLAAITSELLVVETRVDLLNNPAPAMAFYQGDELNRDPTNWWAPNVVGLTALLKSVGFREVTVVSAPPSRWHRFLRALKAGPAFGRVLNQGRVAVHARK